MESLRNFENAAKYDNSNKVILKELASAFYDLRKYTQARDTYKTMVDLGDGSASTYKQLMLLSFNLRHFDDAVLYAKKLKQADPEEKVSYYIGKVQYDQENYGESNQNAYGSGKGRSVEWRGALHDCPQPCRYAKLQTGNTIFSKGNHVGPGKNKLALRTGTHLLCDA
jgi:tetratricopeptide (TPR) repeat protein